ncbi:MAG: hypothetical protein H7336_07985 [Bacteriovorax sp.]|nr:hypothetical protein [Bacteriovorax sp.]
MSNNKNIDQLLENLDSLLEIKVETSSINIEEVARLYHEKKLSEQKGNSRQIIGLILLCISLFFSSSAMINRINSITIGVLAILTFWLNYKAKKEIAEQDLSVSFNDFTLQRKKIAISLLKQFKGMRIIFSIAFSIVFYAYLYDYINEPHVLKLFIYPIVFISGSALAFHSIESGIKEYRELAKAQD